MSPQVHDARTLARLRRSLLALVILGSVITLAELLLTEHTEDLNQLIPVLLLAAAIPLCLLCLLLPSRVAWNVWRFLMVLFFVSGFLGVYLHFSAKMEFALEGQPDLTGWALFVEALEGTSPPILAPLTMAGLAALGLLWTYRNVTRV